MEEAGTLIWRNHISHNIANSRQNFLHKVLQLVKISSLETSSVSIYSECTKTAIFSILGFFRPGVKLGFDFPGVSPNQKYRSISLNFYFDQERNPMTGSLKNYSSIKIPNFSQQTLKMARIKFYFDRKMRPSMES